MGVFVWISGDKNTISYHVVAYATTGLCPWLIQHMGIL